MRRTYTPAGEIHTSPVHFLYPIGDDTADTQHALLPRNPNATSIPFKRCPRELNHRVSPANRHRRQCRRGRRRRRTCTRTPTANTPGRVSQWREMNHLLLPQSVRMSSAIGTPARRRRRRCAARVRRPRVTRIRSRRNHPPRMPMSTLGIILSRRGRSMALSTVLVRRPATPRGRVGCGVCQRWRWCYL